MDRGTPAERVPGPLLKIVLAVRVSFALLLVVAFVYGLSMQFADSRRPSDLTSLEHTVSEGRCIRRGKHTDAYLYFEDAPRISVNWKLLGRCERVNTVRAGSVASLMVDEQRRVWELRLDGQLIFSVADYQKNLATGPYMFAVIALVLSPLAWLT